MGQRNPRPPVWSLDRVTHDWNRGPLADQYNDALDTKDTMRKFLKILRSSFLWVLLAPFAVQGIGAASNQAVLIANHDQFPVMVNPVKLEELRPLKHGDEEDTVADIVAALTGTKKPAAKKPSALVIIADDAGMLDEVHCIMTDQTHLNFLADVFDMHDGIYSIGDFVLMLGEWMYGFCPLVFVALVFKKCWDADAI